MREVTINGKTVVIERGKEPAVVNMPGKGRSKSDFRLLLEAMDEGESVLLPVTPKDFQGRYSATMAYYGKKAGCRFAYRSEGEGVRVYRLAGKVGDRRQNAAAKRRPFEVEVVTANGAARW